MAENYATENQKDFQKLAILSKKFYRRFCAQHLYSAFSKYNLLRLQLTVTPTTKLRLRRSFQPILAIA